MERTKRYDHTDDVEWDMHLLQTYVLESLLPMTIDPQNIARVLDVPCRLGYWADALAHAYPHMHVIALDNDPDHIAAIQQRTNHPDNIYFEASDLEQFPQQRKYKFDLIHVDAPLVFRPPQGWDYFLVQCRHQLKRGGLINLVSIVPGMGSSDAYQHIVYLARQWESRASLGKTSTRETLVSKTPTRGVFPGADQTSGTDRTPGATTFCNLLKQAGFTHIRYTLHPIDLSGQVYQRFLDSTILEIKQSLYDAQLTNKEELTSLLLDKKQQTNDMYFCAMGMIISILAQKS